jgi:hypothetical protein
MTAAERGLSRQPPTAEATDFGTLTDMALNVRLG